MSNFYVGTQKPRKSYIGASKVNKIYFGTQMVWQGLIPVSKPINLTPIATYNGGEITNGYTCPSGITVVGNTSGTNVGAYIATYTPDTGYCWNDGDTSAVTITLTISRASAGNKPSNTTCNYTGGLLSPYNMPSGVSGSGTINAVEGGNYTAYYTPDNNYCWSDSTSDTVTLNWSIQYVWNKYNVSPYYSYTTEDFTVEHTGTQLLASKHYAARSQSTYTTFDFDSSTGLFKLKEGAASIYGVGLKQYYMCCTIDNASLSYYYVNECLRFMSGNQADLYPDGIAKATYDGDSSVIRKYYSYIVGYNKGDFIEQVANIANIYPSDAIHTDGLWYVKTW